MVDTIKFSQMPSGGDLANNEMTPGLQSGANVLFNNPWTFLAPGTTAQRPVPSAAINYRLRFNTDDQLYEYYDAITAVWTQLQESAFTVGPFVTFTADASLPDAQNLGALTNGLLKQTITTGVATLNIAVNGTDYYGPGFVIRPADGGTGVNNGALTINLGSATIGFVLTSDSAGNATWQAQGFMTGAVLLNPSADQVILAHNLQLAAGEFISGSPTGGMTGMLVMYSPTAASGQLIIHAANSSGNFSMQITNASFGQPCVITIPDPVNNNANFILSTAGGTQHITAFGLQVDAGSLISGLSTGSTAGQLVLFSPTATSGGIKWLAANSAGNFTITFSNDSFGQAAAINVPDPGATTAKFLLDTSAAGKTLNYQLTMPSIAFSTTSGIIGAATNNAAAAGSVGEFIIGTKSFGIPVSLTTDIATDVIAISLTAGDWDIWGNVGFLGGSSTLVTALEGWISQTSATHPTNDFLSNQIYTAAGTTVFASGPPIFNVQQIRISLATTTTIFLSVFADFTVSTCSAFGNIMARRVR